MTVAAGGSGNLELRDANTGLVVAGRVELARSFARRLRGLLGRKSLPAGSAMVIEPCRQVHTWGMGFPIDVVFLDERGRVVAGLENLPPGRISPCVRAARSVIELPAGTIKAAGVEKGHLLQIVRREVTK